MEWTDRVVNIGLVIAAIMLFGGALTAESRTLSIIGFFLAACLVWLGVFYALAVFEVRSP